MWNVAEFRLGRNGDVKISKTGILMERRYIPFCIQLADFNQPESLCSQHKPIT